jgi:hypothetical protein
MIRVRREYGGAVTFYRIDATDLPEPAGSYVLENAVRAFQERLQAVQHAASSRPRSPAPKLR